MALFVRSRKRELWRAFAMCNGNTRQKRTRQYTGRESERNYVKEKYENTIIGGTEEPLNGTRASKRVMNNREKF